MKGHKIGELCVIVGPLGHRCLGNEVTILGPLKELTLEGGCKVAAQRVTMPANVLNRRKRRLNAYWAPENLRPINQDTDDSDTEVIEALLDTQRYNVTRS